MSPPNSPRPAPMPLVADLVEIHDAEDETFDLFSQPIPSSNLGFVDAEAVDLQVDVGNQTFTIRQSQGILRSDRSGGTTGAVVWKVTPLVAAWLADQSNVFWQHHILSSDAIAVELGCGIGGLIALALHGLIYKYVLTDQPYVMKTLSLNIDENIKPETRAMKGKKIPSVPSGNQRRLLLSSFDWESDSVERLKSIIGAPAQGADLIVACDCIYNDFLVAPFVRACKEIAKLRDNSLTPTVLLIAQQQRSPDVLEYWLRETLKEFRVWRLQDALLHDPLKAGSGYVLHIALLKR